MIRPNIRRFLLILGLLLIIFLTGCSNESEQFVQGYWYRGDVHFMDQWYFDRGTYDHQMGVFDGNTIRSRGRYNVLDFQEDSLILELDDEGLSFNDERPQIVIKLNWESDTIRIRGETFERILP